MNMPEPGKPINETINVQAADSPFAERIEAICRQPLEDCSAEDLQLLISQSVALELAVPRALALLEEQPFAEGSYYAGDLFVNVLKTDASFWEQHPDLHNRLSLLTKDVQDTMELIESTIREHHDSLPAED